jgi:hypothetical protein
MKVFFRMLAVLALWMGISSCAATQMVAEWQSPEFTGPPFKKVMVIGLAKDKTIRKVFEDVFARTLAANGMEVLVGYNYIPEPVIEREKVEKLLNELGADAVLISALKKTEKTGEVIQNQPATMYGYDYGGIAVQYRLAYVETNLYRVSDAQLVWSGMTESVDQRTLEKEVADFSKVVVKKLKDKKFLY